MFRDYYLGLSEEERGLLAQRAGTTANYIQTHLIAPPARRKTPSKELMNRLADACATLNAPFSRTQLLEYFYEKSVA